MNNLYNKDAKEKIESIVNDVDFAMMATQLTSKPSHIIPMSTKKVDDEGYIWFLSGRDSEHNSNINKDNKIELIYSSPKSMTFMSMYAEAHISLDKKVLENLYTSADDNWFEGIDDPNLSAIKVKPLSAHYWEPKDNKLITLIKMGVGAVTDNKQDIGESGQLHVN